MLRTVAIAPALACTPLGVWVYDDPKVTVSRVRVGSDSLSDAPVLVALELENINDYPLASVHVELSLELDDLHIGELYQDSTLILAQDTTSALDLPMVLASGEPAGRVAALGSGAHRFAVVGKTMITTPFGNREVRFAQEGDLEFDPGDTAASATPAASAGTLVLPAPSPVILPRDQSP